MNYYYTDYQTNLLNLLSNPQKWLHHEQTVRYKVINEAINASNEEYNKLNAEQRARVDQEFPTCKGHINTVRTRQDGEMLLFGMFLPHELNDEKNVFMKLAECLTNRLDLIIQLLGGAHREEASGSGGSSSWFSSAPAASTSSFGGSSSVGGPSSAGGAVVGRSAFSSPAAVDSAAAALQALQAARVNGTRSNLGGLANYRVDAAHPAYPPALSSNFSPQAQQVGFERASNEAGFGLGRLLRRAGQGLGLIGQSPPTSEGGSTPRTAAIQAEALAALQSGSHRAKYLKYKNKYLKLKQMHNF